MALIPHQNEIDIWLTEDGTTVVICERDGHFNEDTNVAEDALIGIHISHLDTVINALLAFKKQIGQNPG